MLSFHGEKLNKFAHDLCDTASILWKLFSIRVLKPYFGIETNTYKWWHLARCKRRQRELDQWHGTKIYETYYAPDYE